MILGAALISGGVFGQINKPKAQTAKALDRGSVQTETPQNNNSNRDIIWENTFSNPSDWALGSEGPVEISFEIGMGLETGGEAQIATINSVTYDDGVAMVDSDEFGNISGVENCWFQTVNPIDLEDHPQVHIEFANQYYMWDGGNSDGNEYCLLEISTDGVTWPDVNTFEVSQADPGTRFELWPNMSTQDVVANPTLVRFNISEVAGGEEEVYLRFRWKGTFGYAWFVDDIVIFDGAENDLSIQGESFGNGSAYTNSIGTKFVPVVQEGEDTFIGFEYTQYPESQRPEIMAITPLLNWGTNDVTDAVLTGTFNGTTISSDPQEILAGEATDSISVLSWPTEDLAVGSYDMELEIASGATDEVPENNSAVASLEMTEYIMARDENELVSGTPGLGRRGAAFSSGPVFEIFGDATVYAIDFALTTNSTPGEECLVQLLDATTENFDPLMSSESVQIWEDNYNAFTDDEVVWVTIPLSTPFDVTPDDLLLPVVTYFGGEESDVTANSVGLQLGESQTVPEQEAFIFGPFGADQAVNWFFTTECPMVRLNFDPNAVVSVNELEDVDGAFGLGQNMPNPATGVTTINYELFQTGKVIFEVFDIAGKVVHSSNEGQRGIGAYALQLDTQSFNSGIYTYTLTVNGERLTKKMVVN